MKWEYLYVEIWNAYFNYYVDGYTPTGYGKVSRFKSRLTFPNGPIYFIPEGRFLDTHTLLNDLGQFGWEFVKDEPGFFTGTKALTFKRSNNGEKEIYFDSSFRKKWSLVG